MRAVVEGVNDVALLRVRRGREHLVDLERSEQIYLVIRDHSGLKIINHLYRRMVIFYLWTLSNVPAHIAGVLKLLV